MAHGIAASHRRHETNNRKREIKRIMAASVNVASAAANEGVSAANHRRGIASRKMAAARQNQYLKRK